MLIIFKSPASGDVIMFEQNGKEILGLLGKDPNQPKGIVTLEQLPGAIAALRSAIDADKASGSVNARSDKDGENAARGSAVRLFQRALPVLELLQFSLKAKVPVNWGA